VGGGDFNLRVASSSFSVKVKEEINKVDVTCE